MESSERKITPKHLVREHSVVESPEWKITLKHLVRIALRSYRIELLLGSA